VSNIQSAGVLLGTAILFWTLQFSHDPIQPAESQAAAIEGLVVDQSTQQPIADATIEIADLGLSARTDSAGTFGWSDIQLSTSEILISVAATAQSYGKWTLENARLIAGDTLLLSIEMSEDPVHVVVPSPRSIVPEWPKIVSDLERLPSETADQTGLPLPTSIRVRVTGKAHCDLSAPYTVETIDFRDYLKHVLPNEWDTAWPTESVRAGAMAVKMYAWSYIVEGGKWPDADVYDSTCDQVYNPAVSYAKSNQAVDFTWNWRLLRGSQLLRTFYRGLLAQCPEDLHGSCMGQIESSDMAYDGLTWDEILYAFYDNSQITPVVDPPGGFALRFYGNGYGDLDRVKIPIDPHVPADVGAGDFTIEWWMKAYQAENQSTSCQEGADNWIRGNILFDRDVFGAGDCGDYGISLYGGVIAFGVDQQGTGNTICGTMNVADGAWHHVAVTRDQTVGTMRIFVDGVLDADGAGPAGDVSYRDGRLTSYPNSDPYLVIGAEKHDAGSEFPSFSGWIDEVRLSDTVRYVSPFVPQDEPLPSDANTAALYHFDEGVGNVIGDSSGFPGGPSNGIRKYGGIVNGPEWTIETPFATYFLDVLPGYWAFQWIQAIADAGLTAGYLDGTYRPENRVTRAEMAVFLKKGIDGSTFTPPAPDGGHPFTDITGNWAEAWIEELYDEGLAGGFPDGTYRPDNWVTRAEIAVFLLKAMHGAGYSPPQPSGGSFGDIAGHWAEAWIEQLKLEGITAGYPDNTYRPENTVTRAEMAIFLVNSFALPLP
jgi:hypothetical protein